jgi:hypothetical protein
MEEIASGAAGVAECAIACSNCCANDEFKLLSAPLPLDFPNMLPLLLLYSLMEVRIGQMSYAMETATDR